MTPGEAFVLEGEQAREKVISGCCCQLVGKILNVFGRAQR